MIYGKSGLDRDLWSNFNKVKTLQVGLISADQESAMSCIFPIFEGSLSTVGNSMQDIFSFLSFTVGLYLSDLARLSNPAGSLCASSDFFFLILKENYAFNMHSLVVFHLLGIRCHSSWYTKSLWLFLKALKILFFFTSISKNRNLHVCVISGFICKSIDLSYILFVFKCSYWLNLPFWMGILLVFYIIFSLCFCLARFIKTWHLLSSNYWKLLRAFIRLSTSFHSL